MDALDSKQEILDQWLAKAREKEPEALSKLCTHYYPLLLRFMRYRVGADIAEDLAGETIVKIMRSIHRQNGRFEPWLYRLARNVIIDHVRHRNARPEVEMNEEQLETLTDGNTPSERVEQSMDVQVALEKISDEHREFLTFKFIQGLDNHEIGQITGQKMNAVRAMQFRALKAMREVLVPTGGEA